MFSFCMYFCMCMLVHDSEGRCSIGVCIVYMHLVHCTVYCACIVGVRLCVCLYLVRMCSVYVYMCVVRGFYHSMFCPVTESLSTSPLTVTVVVKHTLLHTTLTNTIGNPKQIRETRTPMYTTFLRGIYTNTTKNEQQAKRDHALIVCETGWNDPQNQML